MDSSETPTEEAGLEAHPAVAEYLDALPEGWKSYPECKASASLINALRAIGAFADLATLPPALASLVSRPLRDDEWIPEVEYVALMLAILDDSFGGDRRAFLDWASEANARRMARTIDPAILTTSLDVLLENTAALWNRFHRGTTLRVVGARRDGSMTRFDYPLRLYPAVLIDYIASACATSLTRVDAALLEMETSTKTEGDRSVTTFTARWRVA
jgi:hypothetical protein